MGGSIVLPFVVKQNPVFVDFVFFLLSYLINLNYYMLLKVDGKPLQEDPAVERLVELRTVSVCKTAMLKFFCSFRK